MKKSRCFGFYAEEAVAYLKGHEADLLVLDMKRS